MAIMLDHVIIPSRHRRESARFLADLLGVPWEESRGEFTPVYVNDALTVDFADREQFGSRPRGENDMQINRRLGGKNVYWEDSDGHLWEILTVSYARADSPPLAAAR